jgi:hypothetical protein
MPFVSGFLKVRHPGDRVDNSLPGGENPVDPGYGIGEGRPDNSLPGGGYIDNTLPPPPGIWPPPVGIWPPTPLPPNYPMPPGSIWPSPGVPTHPIAPGGSPGTPDNSLPRPPGRPDNSLPRPPGTPDNTLPGGGERPDNSLPSQKYLVAIVGVSSSGGLKVVGYTVVDPSLSPGQLPVMPPTAQPK